MINATTYERLRAHGVQESDLAAVDQFCRLSHALPPAHMYPLGDVEVSGVRLEWSVPAPCREISVEISGATCYFYALNMQTGQDEELDGDAAAVVLVLQRWLGDA